MASLLSENAYVGVVRVYFQRKPNWESHVIKLIAGTWSTSVEGLKLGFSFTTSSRPRCKNGKVNTLCQVHDPETFGLSQVHMFGCS